MYQLSVSAVIWQSFIHPSMCTYSQWLCTAWYSWDTEMNQASGYDLRTLDSSVGAQWHQGTWLILITPHGKVLMYLRKKASHSWVPGTRVSMCALCRGNAHIHITLSFLLRPLVEMGGEEPDHATNRLEAQVLAVWGGGVFVYQKLKNWIWFL